MTAFDVRTVEQFTIDVLRHVGVPEEEASIVAANLIDADRRGIRSHGLMRLPIYVERIRKGLCRPAAAITTVRETTTTAVLDARFSLGQVAAWRGMELAIRKAETADVGVVVVRNSSHFGTASFYVLEAVRRGMIGIASTNTAPLLPAPGGAERVVGNNPLAIGVPSADPFPVVLDMAMSAAAIGKILAARDRGEPIPPDWATDADGNPTTDPRAALAGSLLPAGGPKGYGLAVMLEILTGILGGGDFGKAIPSMYDTTQRQGISHLLVALRVGAFLPLPLFRERVAAFAAQIKGGARAPGVSEVFLPGEIESRRGEAAGTAGIAYDERLLEELNALAGSVGASSRLG